MIRSALLAVTAALCPLTALADDQTLDIAAPFELKGLDPALSGDIFLRLEIAETLVDSDAKGRLRPGLATEWTTSEDGLEWRFRIREGVVFHDGTMLDAAAAAISLNHARSHEGLLSRAPITDIRADGADLVVALSEPFAILPAFLAEYRSQILAPASYGPDGEVVALIGTGAFRTTEVSPPQTLAAERFEDYWDGAARIPALRYTAVTRSETRALMAEGGDAELVVTLDPASVTRLSELEDLEVVSAPLPRVLMLKLDAASPFFDSAAEREALSMAIDRAGLAQVVLRYDASADQMFPPNMDGWHDAALPPLSYDPEAARALLEQAGWTPGDDGIMQKDGQRFAVDLVTYPDRPELPLTATVLQQLFHEIGVDIRIVSSNSSEIPARHAAGTLQMGLMARNFALVPDPTGTLLQDYAPGGDWGAMGWDNPEAAQLIRRMASEGATPGDRARIAAIFRQDLPVIPIAWYQQTAAISDRVEGITLDPYERGFGLARAGFVE